MTKQQDEAWHQDRRIQIGHIVSTLGLMLTMVATIVQLTAFIGRIDARVQVLEREATLQHDRDERQDKVAADALATLRAQLERIDAKLDRLVEHRGK
jgi:hypothetical protein